MRAWSCSNTCPRRIPTPEVSSPVHFTLIDAVLERSDEHLVACKEVSAAEEYLQDHFPTFPVLPGVLMLEAMVQAARELVQPRASLAPGDLPMVLGGVRALKYGCFVKPGQTLQVRVELLKRLDDGSVEFKGAGVCLDPTAEPGVEPPTAVSGRFTLRQVRLGGTGEPITASTG